MHSFPADEPLQIAPGGDGLLAVLDEREAAVVQRIVEHARRRRLTAAARAITRAGNGWAYPVAAALLFLGSSHAARCIAVAALSLAIAFVVYPPLKRAVARPRPCHLHEELVDHLAPLDRYSFPSGHAMTAAAFAVPIVFAAPLGAAPIAIGGCALVSWSRIALGHHYPSDVLAGTLIGTLIASALTVALLP